MFLEAEMWPGSKFVTRHLRRAKKFAPNHMHAKRNHQAASEHIVPFQLKVILTLGM